MADQVISQANIKHLCTICERFFLEKYNINVTQDTLNKTIPVLLNKIIMYYKKNPPLPPLQEINKIAMQHMKDFILSKTQPPPQQITQQIPPQQIPPQQIPQQIPLSLPPLPPLPIHQQTPISPIQDIKYDPNDLTTGIGLEIAYHYKDNVIQRRPSVYVSRGETNFKFPTINQQIGGNAQESEKYRYAMLEMPINLAVVATNVGFAEQLAEYVFKIFLRYQEVIKNDFCIRQFKLVSLSQPNLYL